MIYFIRMDKSLIKNLPTGPGCYLYKNAGNEVIYVGKAKNLRNRIRSYFTPRADLSPAKRLMVEQIASTETILVSNETEALFLESSLIKKYRPRYNVDMKDDKNFCYLKITAGSRPDISVVRRIDADRATYFGPFLSAAALRQTLKIFLRPGREAYQKQLADQEYLDLVDQIKNFFRGRTEPIVADLKTKMDRAAEEKNYELAALYRDRLEAIRHVSLRQKVITTQPKDIDVISLFSWHQAHVINLFRIRGGKLLDKLNLDIKTELSQPGEIINEFINQYYPHTKDLPDEIMLPVQLPRFRDKSAGWFNKKIIWRQPLRGTYKKLIKLGELNAQDYLAKSIPSFNVQLKQSLAAVFNLSHALRLKKTLRRIECYDISNVQGRYAVGSMVVFTDGEPEKKEYRRFTIKYVSGPNDFAMLSEVIARRFRNHPDWPRPDLVIIDGGKGQLHTVLRTVSSLDMTLTVIALAKKHEEIFLPGRKNALRLKKNSPEYYLLQRIRDEAHRFAITAYRQKHARHMSRSVLDDIPGIGPATKKKLLRHYADVEAIRQAPSQDLEKLIGRRKTETLAAKLPKD